MNPSDGQHHQLDQSSNKRRASLVCDESAGLVAAAVGTDPTKTDGRTIACLKDDLRPREYDDAAVVAVVAQGRFVSAPLDSLTTTSSSSSSSLLLAKELRLIPDEEKQAYLEALQFAPPCVLEVESDPETAEQMLCMVKNYGRVTDH